MVKPFEYSSNSAINAADISVKGDCQVAILVLIADELESG